MAIITAVTHTCRTIAGDLLYALRGLRNAPGYAITLLLTLALGLGAATAMLAIVESVLLQPVELNHPEQLVVVSAKHTAESGGYYLDGGQVDSLRRHANSFSGVGVYNTLPKPVDVGDGSRMALVTQMTPDVFQILGVSMKRGRAMNDRDIHAPVAVINAAFWREQLHGRSDVIGTAFRLNGQLRTVIGVLPKGLRFPAGTDFPGVFVPMDLHAKEEGIISGASGTVLARMKPGVTRQQAADEASSVLKFSQPGNAAGKDILTVLSYERYLTGDDEHFVLLGLLGGAAVLLLIACANAAILQIARAAGRTAEMQVRSALGASFWRLLQQLFTESISISLLGAVLSGTLAYAVVAAVRHTYGERYSRFDELGLHWPTVLACVALAVLAGILASLIPVWRLRRQTGVTSATARISRRSHVPGLLVAVQVALTCVLLATAGLFVRTLHALEDTRLGFDPRGITTMVLMPQDPHKTPGASQQTMTQLLDRIAALPGVDSAMTQTSLPFSSYSFTMNGDTNISGRVYQKGDSPSYSLVSANFVHASGMQLIRGRAFQPADDSSAAMVALVNEAFVHRYLEDRDPIGVTLMAHRDPGDKDSDLPWQGALTIVGVVENELQGGELGAEFHPMVYLDYRQLPAGTLILQSLSLWPQLAVRSSLPQATLNAELRAAVKQVAPDMTEMKLVPMQDAIEDSLAQRRLALRLITGFGGVALLLAAVGLYGALASFVVQRRKEIGIRMALGSSRSGATQLVVRQAWRMVIQGLMLGAVGAWLAGRAVRSFLYGVTVLDPYALAGAAFVLFAVCAVAAVVPAWRAAQLDPVEALRSE